MQSDICVALSPDGNVIAVGGRDGIVHVWRTDDAEMQNITRFYGHKGGISSLCFSADNRWLASGSWDTTVIVHDLQTISRELPPPEASATSKTTARESSSSVEN